MRFRFALLPSASHVPAVTTIRRSDVEAASLASKQDGGVRGAGVSAGTRVVMAWGLLALILAVTSAEASSARGSLEKPAGLDDAGWVSLQQAIGKAAAQQARLTTGTAPGTGGAANDRFGNSVALDGDTALVGASFDDVGANNEQGSAYVFIRSGSNWTLQATLTAGDGAPEDFFGGSVALDGDTALVGASSDDVGANSDQGAVYVFTRNGSSWTQRAKLTVSDGEAGDYFGSSVALDVDTALVGAPGDDVGANGNQGSAYVFTRSGLSWTQQAKLTAGDGAADDVFGGSVALDGATTLIGASRDDVGSNSDQGSAYVFTHSGASWTQQAKLTAGDGQGSDRFGNSVALDGDTALVGAFADRVSFIGRGSAYVFTRSGSSWTQQAQLTAGDGEAGDFFGWTVGLAGNTALVGANYDDVAGNGDQGSVYVFARIGASWTQQAKLIAADGEVNDQFGGAVAVDGDTALVGASLDNVGFTDQGSAYVITRSGSSWAQQAQLTAGDSAADDRFGISVAIDGDTALVGAYLDNVGFADQGSAYVFTRSGSSWTLQAQLTAGDGTTSDQFGVSVALAGDTALVGARLDDVGGNSNQGSAYVFTRSGLSWTQQAKLTAGDGLADDEFGISVALDGDTVLVGAYSDDVGGRSNQGSAYVFTRSGSSWTQQAQLTASDGAAGDLLGISVALDAGTALVGASGDNAEQGSAYVFIRSGSSWTQQAKLAANDGASRDYFGSSVAIDGGTALVGASGDNEIHTDQGSAYVFTRTGSSWTQQAKLTAGDAAESGFLMGSDFFGSSVALDGDTALVGAFRDDVGANRDQGSTYVFTRRGSSWTQQAKLTAGDGAAGDSFGESVALSGTTAIVGAPNADNVVPFGNLDEGAAYVFSLAGQQAQSITFANPGAQTFGTTPTLSASASSGLTVTFTSATTSICTITSSGTLSFASLGMCTINADQEGNAAFLAAARVSQSFTVTAVVPGARPDRVVLRENSPAVEISVVANDQIATPLVNLGVLSIDTAPTRGTASVLTRGTASVLDDAIRYVPDANTAGIDSLVYRLCFGGLAPCVDAVLTIDLRPLGLAALELAAGQNGGFRDQTLTGLRALPNARFEAHGLVTPSTSQVPLDSVESAGSPWGAGFSTTVIRTLDAGTAARDWRVLADARTTSGGDLDLYLGFDSNNNGQADASELVCSAAMGAGGERCDLALAAPANGNVRYWVLVHAGSVGQVARLDLFETPLDVPVADRTLVATGPGSLAASATFDVRLSWNDPTFLPGQSRGGWVHVRADDSTSVGWIPVRIDRTTGDAAAYALQSGVEYTPALAPGAAHERLYIDVPPGAERLDVTTASVSNIDLYLARVDAPVASGTTPTIALAPARNLAISSATTPSGNESLTVNNPAPGRWYVTPVNASGATADVVIRATLSGTGPQLRSGGFFNPSRSGNGLFVYPAGSEWAALWYTYLQDGSPTWYYMQGAAPGPSGIWRGSIFRSAWNGSSNRLTVVGKATITPTATSSFTFSYTVDGEAGSEAYSNFSGACPAVNGALLDISGHWFDPLRAGSGYSVQSFPNYEFYLVFGYDAQGVPRYLVSERSGFGGVTETLLLEQLTGACPLCTRTGNPVRATVGTLQRHIEGGTLRNITLSATYVNGVPGTWAANDSVIPLGNLRGCAAP